jgi:hypothetical protein
MYSHCVESQKVWMKYRRVSFYDSSFLRRFTFTTLVQSDRALATCGASLSQLKRPFST